MKKRIAFFTLIILTLIGCDKALEIQHNYEFNQDIFPTNRIVIRAYKKFSEEEVLRRIKEDLSESELENDYLETKNVHQVKAFDSLLRKGVMTDYCCCPNYNYSISFKNDKKLIETYFADTEESKDNVRVFEPGFQYSFIITKENWKFYLKQLQHKE